MIFDVAKSLSFSNPADLFTKFGFSDLRSKMPSKTRTVQICIIAALSLGSPELFGKGKVASEGKSLKAPSSLRSYSKCRKAALAPLKKKKGKSKKAPQESKACPPKLPQRIPGSGPPNSLPQRRHQELQRSKGLSKGCPERLPRAVQSR